MYVAFGYHDAATPYLAAEQAFAHLKISDELGDNIESRCYEAGHVGQDASKARWIAATPSAAAAVKP